MLSLFEFGSSRPYCVAYQRYSNGATSHQAWTQYGKVISQAQINGRPIIVIEFDKMLESRGWKIECLELPYPAEGKIYPTEGWEHVEFVIPSHAETADEF